MRKQLFKSLCCLIFLGSFTTGLRAQTYSFAIDQLQELPPFFSSFMQEYTRDVNENINSGFFFTTQTSSRVLQQGEFQIGLNVGGTIIDPLQAGRDLNDDLPTSPNISLRGRTPSLFGSSDPSIMLFQFRNPDSGNPLVDPYTGELVRLELEIPTGLGLGFGAAPSASLSGAYGVGFGTELKAYVTPNLLSVAGGGEESISFKQDLAWGAQLKHELTYWIPSLQDKGYHIALAGGYGSYALEVQPNLLPEPFVSNFTDDVSITVSDNIESVSYNLTTLSGRLLVGKRFKFGEIALSGSVADNSYEMMSTGGLNIEIVDQSGQTANESAELTNLIDFSGSNVNWGYGAALTLGQGWFRTTLGYRRANHNFASIAFQFHINHKKEKPTNIRDYKALHVKSENTTTNEN